MPTHPTTQNWAIINTQLNIAASAIRMTAAFSILGRCLPSDTWQVRKILGAGDHVVCGLRERAADVENVSGNEMPRFIFVKQSAPGRDDRGGMMWESNLL